MGITEHTPLNTVFNTMAGYNYTVEWSEEDGEYVATVAEFPSLSWLGENADKALNGLKAVVFETIMDGVVQDSPKLFEYAPGQE